jgi:hypothetical protein
MTDQPITPEQADQAAARIRHLHGINYNHSDIRDTLRRLGMPNDEAALNAVLPRLHSDAFELPTVGALRHQVQNLTRERDYLAEKLRNAPTDLDWQAATADRENLRTKLAQAEEHIHRLAAAATIVNDLAGATETDRDQVLAERDKATRERDELISELNEANRANTVTDQALRRALRQRDSLGRRCAVRFEETQELRHQLAVLDRARTTLALSAHGLLGALDEGDLDTPGFIERMREALAAVETSNIRMGLTDKGREILGSPSDASGAGSVPGVVREDSSDSRPEGVVNASAMIVMDSRPSAHNGSSGVSLPTGGETTPETRESLVPERYMMATVAHHQLGDISRPEPNLALITGEDGDNWIGSWVEGYGYFNVRFPKATTRGLTDAEVQAYDGSLLDVGASRYVIRIPAGGEDGPQ